MHAVLVLILYSVLQLSYGASHVAGDHDEKVLKATDVGRSYRLGERFMVECLNRTSDTGEHVSSAHTFLQSLAAHALKP